MRVTILILVAFVLNTPRITAQDRGVWTPLHGPCGGMMQSLAVGADGAVYAAQYGGRVWRSADGGRAWSPVNDGGRTNAFRVFCLPDGAVYSSGLPWLYRSRDNGASWSRVESEFPVWTLTATGSGTRLFAGSSGSVRRSLDDGATWTEITPVDSSRSFFLVDRSVAGVIFAGSWQDGLYKSTNEGAVWQRIDMALPSRNVTFVRVLPGDSLFVGVDAGLVLSLDNGNTWVNRSAGLDSAIVTDMVKHSDGCLYLRDRFQGVMRSCDGGASWSSATQPPFPTLALASVRGDAVLAGAEGGLFRSSDGGVSWTASQDSLFETRVVSLAVTNWDYVLAGTDLAGVYNDIGSRKTWTLATAPVATGLSVRTLAYDSWEPNGEYCYAGSYDLPLLRSTDEGRTWTQLTTVPEGASASVVAVQPQSAGQVYTGSGSGGIARSSDHGDTWQIRGTISDGTRGLAVNSLIAHRNGTLFAGTELGLYRSIDSGATWTNCCAALDRKYVDVLFWNRDWDVFAAYDQSLYRSTDLGGTWTRVYEDTQHGPIQAGCANPEISRQIFLGFGGAVLQSNDNGVSWADLSTDLTGADVLSLTSRGGVVYCGTAFRGVFRTAPLLLGVGDLPPAVPTATLLPPAPNPVGTGRLVDVRFTLPAAGTVRIDLVDLLGRTVRTVVDGHSAAGAQHAVLRTGGIAPGAYRVRCVAGGTILSQPLLILR